MKNKFYLLLFLLLSVIKHIYSNESDSLKNELKKHKSNSDEYFYTIKSIAFYYTNRNTDSAYHYCNYMKKIAAGDSVKMSESYYELAMLLNHTSKFEDAIKHIDSALAFRNETIETTTNISFLSTLGISYWYLGDFSQALSMYLSILKNQELENSKIISTMNNIGILYRNLEDYKNAYKYLSMAYKLIDKEHDIWNDGNTSINLGVVFLEGENNKDSAYYYFRKGYEKMKQIDDLSGQSMALNNLGTLSNDMKNYRESSFYLEKSIEISKRMNDMDGLVYNYLNLGNAYRELNQMEKALDYHKKGFELALEVKNKDNIKSISKQLSKTYELQNNYKDALKYYKIYTQYKDSIFNESKSKEIGKLEATYEMEKKQTEEEQKLNEESRKLKAETERRDNIQYSVIFIAILAVFGTILSLGFIKVSPKFVEGLIFFAFLIFFEFCLVLLDPYVDNYSGGEPAYKLLFNAVLAGAIFPVHAFFENRLKNKIITKGSL